MIKKNNFQWISPIFSIMQLPLSWRAMTVKKKQTKKNKKQNKKKGNQISRAFRWFFSSHFSIWHMQTVQTQIRLLPREQSDQGLHYLTFLPSILWKQNLGEKVWYKVFEILGHLLNKEVSEISLDQSRSGLLVLSSQKIVSRTKK